MVAGLQTFPGVLTLFLLTMNRRRCRLKYFSLAALDLLEALKGRGVRLNLEGENIVIKGYLTDDLRHQIREHKQDLIDLMKDGEHRWYRQ